MIYSIRRSWNGIHYIYSAWYVYLRPNGGSDSIFLCNFKDKKNEISYEEFRKLGSGNKRTRNAVAKKLYKKMSINA